MIEVFVDVMVITTFTLIGFMISVVILRVDREVIGDKRSWFAFILFCVLMVLKSLGFLIDTEWYRSIEPVFGIGAAIILPWSLWKFYSDTRIGPGGENPR